MKINCSTEKLKSVRHRGRGMAKSEGGKKEANKKNKNNVRPIDNNYVKDQFEFIEEKYVEYDT